MTVKQTIRTTVDPDVFAELQHRADTDGVSLFVYVRRVLVEHATVQPVVPVTAEQWSMLRRWVGPQPSRIAAYTGPRNWAMPEDRARIYAWALDHGFTPTN